MIQRYQSKLSGPLLDRIDIHIEVPRVDYDKLISDSRGESSHIIRSRVEAARKIQQTRFAQSPALFANSDMGTREIDTHCKMLEPAKQLLDISIRKMQLSARSYHRVLKLSRTIADLAGSVQIDVPHVAEAIQYRLKSLET